VSGPYPTRALANWRKNTLVLGKPRGPSVHRSKSQVLITPS